MSIRKRIEQLKHQQLYRQYQRENERQIKMNKKVIEDQRKQEELSKKLSQEIEHYKSLQKKIKEIQNANEVMQQVN